MISEGRRQRILEIVDQRGMVLVAELCTLFAVTTATIRRDLESLESEGLLKRVHGGAMRQRGRSYELPFPERLIGNQEAKARLGRVAAELVRDGESLALDAGTTVMAFAEQLCERRNLTIITHNLRAAVELTTQGSHRVLVTGGLLRADELSLVGHLAERTHAEFFVDKLFLGAAGIDVHAGITEFNIEDALIKRSMLAQAKERILLADQSKFGYVALTQVCTLAGISRLVTDAWPPPALARALGEAGVEVTVAAMERSVLAVGTR